MARRVPLKNLFLSAITLVVFLVLLCSGWFVWQVHQFYVTPLAITEKAVSIKVKPSMGTGQVVTALSQQGVLKHINVARLWLRFARPVAGIQVGEYRLQPGLTLMALFREMQVGKVWVHQVRFIEGWTLSQCLQALGAAPGFSHALPKAETTALLKKWDDPHPSLEGQLFPDTYYYQWPMTQAAILKRAYQRMQSILATAWQQRAANTWFQTPYDALILASIVERESALPSERPLIAGVLLNRLQIRMRLHVDPTVYYAVNKTYKEPLTRKDLKVDNPYNTYRYHGLPPTPISMPSQSSIEAVLHPTYTKALYYVAKKDGSHVFTRNYLDHLRAKQRLYPLSPVEKRYLKKHASHAAAISYEEKRVNRLYAAKAKASVATQKKHVVMRKPPQSD